MPALETSDLHQKATLWEANDGPADRYGQQRALDPVEISCRWVWRESQMAGPTGTPVAIDGTVVVNRSIPIGSTLWEGALADWNATGSQFGNDYVVEVVAYRETPSICGRHIRYTLGIAFYRDTPQTVA